MANMIEEFLSAKPFPHLQIDDLLPRWLIMEAANEFSHMPDYAWHSYSGPDESGKRACNRLDAIQEYAPACHALLQFLNSQATVRMLREITGIEGLEADPEFYGGGLHEMIGGSQLGLHLDNELHPTTKQMRRLNLILYLSTYAHDWGGTLDFWDKSRSGVVGTCFPYAGRVLLMQTDQYSYHSVSKIDERAPPRRSLAVYYWSAPRARARFLSAAAEIPDQSLERRRIARSR